MYFSCFAKKSTKRRRLKEALSSALPRRKTPSLRIHPSRIDVVAVHFHSKMITGPYFTKTDLFHNVRPAVLTIPVILLRCAPGVSKGGGSGAGATSLSAPLADFFGYFLVQWQESNITTPHRKLYFQIYKNKRKKQNFFTKNPWQIR